jgi:hypothetical protein
MSYETTVTTRSSLTATDKSSVIPDVAHFIDLTQHEIQALKTGTTWPTRTRTSASRPVRTR